jgi:hypothetical protein
MALQNHELEVRISQFLDRKAKRYPDIFDDSR